VRLEGIDDGIAHLGQDSSWLGLIESEDTLDFRNLGGGGVWSAEGGPIVDDESSSDDLTSSVDGSGDDWNLEEGRKLILLLNGGSWMDQSSLIGEVTVGSDQDILSNSLTENLNIQNISDDLLSLSVNIRMDQSDVIVTGDDVSEGGQALLNTLNDDGVWESVTDVLELLVRGGVWQQKSVSVSDTEATDDASSGNGGTAKWDVVSELGLEGTEMLSGGSEGKDTVAVGQSGEDSNLSAILVLNSDCHVICFVWWFGG